MRQAFFVVLTIHFCRIKSRLFLSCKALRTEKTPRRARGHIHRETNGLPKERAAESIAQNNQIIRADGLGIVELLEAILPLFPLDQYDEKSFVVMAVEAQDNYKPEIWNDFEGILKQYEPSFQMTFLDRFDYYEHSKKAYAVIATGEKAQYANVILKKGVIY